MRTTAKSYPNRLMVGSETIIGELPYNWAQVQKHTALIGDLHGRPLIIWAKRASVR